MGVRARLRAVCVVANPRNSQAIAVVCASQPIPNRIPHTFTRDHEHVLSVQFFAHGDVGNARIVVHIALDHKSRLGIKPLGMQLGA